MVQYGPGIKGHLLVIFQDEWIHEIKSKFQNIVSKKSVNSLMEGLKCSTIKRHSLPKAPRRRGNPSIQKPQNKSMYSIVG